MPRPYLFRRKERVFFSVEGRVLEPYSKMPVGSYTAQCRSRGVRGICRMHNVASFEVVVKEYGYLAEPSYPADAWVLGETQADVAQQLIDRYYKGKPLNDEELLYKAWLQQFADGTRRSSRA